MPIEIQCPSCQKNLRVPDTAAGKQARCPECEQLIVVPGKPANAPQAPPAGMSPTPNPYAENASMEQVPLGSNPYAAPGTAAVRAPATLTVGTGRLDASHAVGTAWMLFKENAGVLIGALVVLLVVGQAVGFVQQIVQTIALEAAGGRFGPNGFNLTPAQISVFVLVTLGFTVVSQAIQAFLWSGLVNIHLRIARGQQVDFGMLFSGGRWFVKTYAGSLLFLVMIGLGFAALIVPGVYLALRYWSFFHFIVDKDCGILESFRLAGDASNGNKGETFLLWVITTGLVMLGMIMLCLGILATGPVAYLSYTVAYLMMTGQPFRQRPRVV